MSVPQIPILERPTTFDGQRLEAVDFAAMFAHPRGVRWLHNRTLHGWGIGAGFDVVGDRGDRFVRVDPGYAIDCLGRDIILSESMTLPVPQIGGNATTGDEYILVVSYLDDAALSPSESREGACATGGAVRRPERPLIRWKSRTASDSPFDPGNDIALVSVRIKDCRIFGDPDRSVRPDLSARVGAYVAQGESAEGATGWKAIVGQSLLTGVYADINATAGAFRRAPIYFAALIGPRVPKQGAWYLLDGPLTVSLPTASGFRATITLPTGAQLGGQPLNPASLLTSNNPGGLEQLVETTLNWTVAWIGVEA